MAGTCPEFLFAELVRVSLVARRRRKCYRFHSRLDFLQFILGYNSQLRLLPSFFKRSRDRCRRVDHFDVDQVVWRESVRGGALEIEPDLDRTLLPRLAIAHQPFDNCTGIVNYNSIVYGINGICLTLILFFYSLEERIGRERHKSTAERQKAYAK